jgi:diacylglycerol kinase (ATP)
MAGGQSDNGAARRVALVVSPHAGTRGSRVAPAEALDAAGLVVAEQLPVSELDRNLPRGSEWQAQGIQVVVAAGGDGTIGAVATQLAETDLPLGILPMGTSNDSARALGIPLDVRKACEVIARGTTVAVDVGYAQPAVTEPFGLSETHQHPATAEHEARAAQGAYFLHTLTLGLNVEFARLATDVANRRRWGGLTYVASAFEALSRFQSVPVTLRLAGVKRTGADGAGGAAPDEGGNLTVTHHVVEVAAVNLPVFGGGLNLRVPDVRGNDRLLDFMLFEALDDGQPDESVESWLDAIGVARRRAAQRSPDRSERPLFTLPGLLRYQAREAVIETPEPMDVTLDGEIRARTPVRIGLAPAPIRVLVPGSASAVGAPEAPGVRQTANGAE